MKMTNSSEEIKYSIIVPVYNNANTLERCLKGLMDQDLGNGTCEIIFVNDGSTDHSLQIVNRYPVKVLKSMVKTGAYAARNRGIANSSGNILLFTDATCYPCRDWMQNLILGFTDERIGCVAGQILSAPPRTLVGYFSEDRKTHDMSSNLNREIPSFACGNVAIKREVFERIGLFDESLESGGDGDFAFRVHLDGKFRVAYQPNACVYYNHRETLRGLLGQAFKYGRGIARFRLNYYGSPNANKSISLTRNLVILAIQFGSIIFIPWRILKEYKKTGKLIAAMVYPSIDKLHSIWSQSGIVAGLIQYAGHKRSPIPKLNSNARQKITR